MFQQRLITGLSKLNELYQEKKVLLVAHGAVIHELLKLLANGDLEIERTPLFNACISNLHFKEEQWHIKDYNQVQHLSEFHNPLNNL